MPGNPAAPKSFPYPPIWKDEARVQVLLAPFRERDVNPENYDSKMKFWKDIIVEYCLFRGKTYFCKQELQQTFALGRNRIPACLDTVFDELTRLGLIRSRNDYESDPLNSWSGWAVNKFWRTPLNKVKNVFLASSLVEKDLEEFVHLEVIKKYCSDLQVLFEKPPYPGTLHHYGELKDRVAAVINLSEGSFHMCLETLNVLQKIGLSRTEGTDGSNLTIHLVKIPSKSESAIIITESDHAIHNLLVTKQVLLKQLESIEKEILENEEKARLYVRDNKRMLAKTYLRKKHLLEKNHEKRSNALHNIEVLISNVDDAKSNGIVLEAYKYGSKALQDALTKSNLTFDNVEEVVSDVRETVEMSNELQDSLGNIKFNESTSIDDNDDELERELRELLGQPSEMASPKAKNEGNNNYMTDGQVSHKVEISDAELIAMLDALDVENSSPSHDASSTTTNVYREHAN
uniref:Charged multivesicular body protein 7 n=1 Tax=Stomoxys calcitrans TaxID=35570 RepID=A0A1I8NXI1_STOCA